jgi:hypothetical protein
MIKVKSYHYIIILIIISLFLIFSGGINLELISESGITRYIAFSVYASESGTFIQTPYFGTIGSTSPFFPAIMVHVFNFLYSLNINLFAFSNFLVIIVWLILPIVSFYWLRKYGGDKVGFFCSFLILTIPALTMSLGSLFHIFIPLSGLMFLIAIEKNKLEKKSILIAGISLGILFSLYSFAWGILILYIISFLVLNFSIKNLVKSSLIVIISILIFLGFNGIFFIENGIPNYAALGSVTVSEVDYFASFWHAEQSLMPSIFRGNQIISIIFIISAIVAMIYSFGTISKFKFKFKINKKILHLIIWLILILTIYIVLVTDNGAINPTKYDQNILFKSGVSIRPSTLSIFTRLNIYVSWTLAILSGIGFGFIIKKFKNIKRVNFLILLVCFLMLTLLLSNAYQLRVPENKVVGYSKQTVEGLLWLKNQPGNMVVSNMYTIGNIYTLSQKLSLTEGPIGASEYLSWDDAVDRLKFGSLIFYLDNINDINEISNFYNISYVILIKQEIGGRGLAKDFRMKSSFPLIYKNTDIEIYKIS